MSEVPAKVSLEMPPGEPAALEDLVRSVAGVAELLTVLDRDLAGPGVAAPGWLGADATAAAGQVVAVAGLSRAMSGAVLLATARLSAHADRVREVRHQVTQLREEQDEDHRSAWRRIGDLDGPQGQFQFDGPAAVAIVEELRAAEAARRRRHAMLLDDVSDDAARTARALGEAQAVIGGTGRPGDEARTVAHLAGLLPGWGDAELAALGRASAAALAGPEPSLEQLADVAEAAAPHAGSPAFAGALLGALGVEGVRTLLAAIGSGPYESTGAVARLLSSALGAAAGGNPHGPVGAVLEASYVTGRGDPVDPVVAGMVAVLAAGSTSGTTPLRPVTVAAWARQMLLVEEVEGRRAGESLLYRWPAEVSDAAAVAVGVLADSGDAAAAAGLLADADVWQAALARSWNDDGSALGRLIRSASSEDGSAGARAVGTGLDVIGGGLIEGDPDDRGVSRRTVDLVSADIGRAVADQIGVAVGALAAGADGSAGQRPEVLRGLAYVSVDRTAAAAVDSALQHAVEPLPLHRTDGGAPPLPAVALPAAFQAVQEYGQRLTHALDAFEAQERAEDFATWWDWTIGLPATVGGALVRRSVVGTGLGLLEGYGAILLGADGTWDDPVDRGLRFTSDDAAARARSQGELRTDVDVLAQQAKASFERTAAVLGVPDPPKSPPVDGWGPLVEAFLSPPDLPRPRPR